jgi:hypothetical protein
VDKIASTLTEKLEKATAYVDHIESHMSGGRATGPGRSVL